MENLTTYIKGFNHGYILQKYRPETAKELLGALESQGQYEQGFGDGSREVEKEIDQQKLDELSRLGKDDNLGLNR